ncbi:hypothetical protein D3OALGA1CA_5048 [Olavius algarvensis associated proteobacterium Delta 3]|nr:hypothetical protein D3OALGA1CA_5048 [Olavius algarvensis associated proteobacterium Delta 3]
MSTVVLNRGGKRLILEALVADTVWRIYGQNFSNVLRI